MAKYVFTRDQLGTTYGIHNVREGQEIELDEGFAADAVASGLLKPFEAEAEVVEPESETEPTDAVEPAEAPVKRGPGRPRKAE